MFLKKQLSSLNIIVREIELGKDNIDSPYDETVIFTGFYSTAKEIIQELQVPEKDVDWVN